MFTVCIIWNIGWLDRCILERFRGCQICRRAAWEAARREGACPPQAYAGRAGAAAAVRAGGGDDGRWGAEDQAPQADHQGRQEGQEKVQGLRYAAYRPIHFYSTCLSKDKRTKEWQKQSNMPIDITPDRYVLAMLAQQGRCWQRQLAKSKSEPPFHIPPPTPHKWRLPLDRINNISHSLSAVGLSTRHVLRQPEIGQTD